MKIFTLDQGNRLFHSFNIPSDNIKHQNHIRISKIINIYFSALYMLFVKRDLEERASI